MTAALRRNLGSSISAKANKKTPSVGEAAVSKKSLGTLGDEIKSHKPCRATFTAKNITLCLCEGAHWSSRLLPRKVWILPSSQNHWVSILGSVHIEDWRAGLVPVVEHLKPKRKLPPYSRIAGSSGSKGPWIPQKTANSEQLG